MIIVYILIAMHVTWVYYLAAMNLKRNQPKLTPTAKVMAYPVIIVGVTIDWVFNVTVGSLLFLEPPMEWKELFSGRCERHLHEQDWQGKQARFWCRNLLDPFDPDGQHCN